MRVTHKNAVHKIQVCFLLTLVIIVCRQHSSYYFFFTLLEDVWSHMDTDGSPALNVLPWQCVEQKGSCLILLKKSHVVFLLILLHKSENLQTLKWLGIRIISLVLRGFIGFKDLCSTAALIQSWWHRYLELASNRFQLLDYCSVNLSHCRIIFLVLKICFVQPKLLKRRLVINSQVLWQYLIITQCVYETFNNI